MKTTDGGSTAAATRKGNRNGLSIQMKDGWLFSMIPAMTNPTLGTDWAENITLYTVAYDNRSTHIDSVVAHSNIGSNNNERLYGA